LIFHEASKQARGTGRSSTGGLSPGKQANVAAPAIPSSDGPTKQSRSTHRIPRASPTA